MANPYFNPAATKPDVGQVPPGLAGVWMAQQNQDYRNAMSLQDALSRTGVNQAEAEYNTYNQDEPLRAAARAKGISEADLATMLARARQTPDYTGAMVRGDIGKAGTEEAAGRAALGTVQGKIDVENAGNHLKQVQTFMNHLDLKEPMFQDTTPGSAPGVTRGQENYNEFMQQLPKSAQSAFGQQYSPERMKAIRQKLENSIEQANKMSQIGEHNKGNLAVARETGQWHLLAAQARTAAQKKEAIDRFLTGDDNNKLSIGAGLLANPDLEENIKSMVTAMMAQARQNLAAKAQSHNPYQIPLTPSQPNPGMWTPGGGPQQPNSNVGIPGVIRR